MSSTETIRTALLLRYPEIGTLVSSDNDVIDAFIEDAKLMENETVDGSKYDRLVMLLACYYIDDKYGTSAGNPGAIQSEKIGDQSVTYASISSKVPANLIMYLSNSYGKLYVELKMTIVQLNRFVV